MYQITDNNEITNYLIGIRNKVSTKIKDNSLEISINNTEYNRYILEINTIKNKETIIKYYIKTPNKKSISDIEMEILSHKIVELYYNTKDNYYFYLSDILKKIKKRHIIKNIKYINKEKDSYRDLPIKSYYYKDFTLDYNNNKIYSNDEDKLKLVEKINIDKINKIYESLKDESKKETSFIIRNLWEDNIFYPLDNVDLKNIKNIKFIDTKFLNANSQNNISDKYLDILTNLVLYIYNHSI